MLTSARTTNFSREDPNFPLDQTRLTPKILLEDRPGEVVAAVALSSNKNLLIYAGAYANRINGQPFAPGFLIIRSVNDFDSNGVPRELARLSLSFPIATIALNSSQTRLAIGSGACFYGGGEIYEADIAALLTGNASCLRQICDGNISKRTNSLFYKEPNDTLIVSGWHGLLISQRNSQGELEQPRVLRPPYVGDAATRHGQNVHATSSPSTDEIAICVGYRSLYRVPAQAQKISKSQELILRSSSQEYKLDTRDVMTDFKYSPDGDHLAVVGVRIDPGIAGKSICSGFLKILTPDGAGFKMVHEQDVIAPANVMQWSEDGKRIVIGTDDSVDIFAFNKKMTGCNPLSRILSSLPVNSVDIESQLGLVTFGTTTFRGRPAGGNRTPLPKLPDPDIASNHTVVSDDKQSKNTELSKLEEKMGVLRLIGLY